MAPQTDLVPIRWTKRFLRADADQPAGTMRMVLSLIRRNQWVLLEWRPKETSQFYPVKKSEISTRLDVADAEIPVAQVLHLERGLPSQTLRTFENVYSSAETEASQQEPWLRRRVMLDDSGSPIAIGNPKSPIGILKRSSRPLESRELIGSSEMASEAAPPEQLQSYSIVRIFYGTDRSRTNSGYSNRRDQSEVLHFGTCDVTIPRDHRQAQFESPRWWKFEFVRNPAKHITVQRIQETSEVVFHSMLRNYFSAIKDHSVLVFIHGFHTSFEDGARRTAQLSYDLGFQGAPILYSWPSADSFLGYLADETTIEWTQPHLCQFLTQIACQSGATTLHVIAHSMGNRALLKVLQSLPVVTTVPFFNQIVLTAPDIDTGEFLQLASSIQDSGTRTTLYASSNDNAIRLSKKVHRYPRAGESGSDIIVAKGVDTIDASTVDTSFVGHSYFADKRTVLSDLFYLIRDGKEPNQRFGLEVKTNPNGQYWVFRS